MILEIGKSYLKKIYDGDLKECVKKKDGILWTPERIKNAFAFGNGTEKELKKYMENNRSYCYFVNI
ncbi:hypothetical protein [Mediterraneibacter gnavus]|uniref:hypothetical protein n=1 Tax=Mediterraneibacter gnavus TaxID=33038 RepID=UPI000466D4ED|nr:hypothetical protein [Mediterraneibacter gnavus]